MAFCSKCGSSVPDGTGFCPQCGTGIGAAAIPQPFPASPAAAGLQENVAAALSYLVGWLTGIVFLLIDKRPFVRFHAAQSIVFFGGIFVIQILLGFLGHSILGLLIVPVSLLLWLAEVIAWVVLLIFAFQGKNFEIPIVAPIAKNIAGKV